jgi:hypothetical protein
MNRRRIAIFAALTLLVFAALATAQKKEKKWTDWSKQDAEKMLTSSPWAQTQTDTDTSQMMYSPTNDPRLGGRTTENTDSRLKEGSTNQAVNLVFHVRMFSARPIRQALVRLMELQQQQKLAPQQIERLHSYGETKLPDSIIITVTVESNDQRQLGPVMQLLNSSTTATIKNNTYLQRSDGKQLFLEQYITPTSPESDGFGARFIFLRNPDEQPFFNEKSGEIHFFSQFSDKVKIDRRFKLADMMYEGALEY